MTQPQENGGNLIQFGVREGSTGRSKFVLISLEIQPEYTRIERTWLVIQD